MMMINWEVYYGENGVLKRRGEFSFRNVESKGGESPLHWRRGGDGGGGGGGKEYTLHRVVEPLPLATGELV